ncbi:YceI family protein [bacterium]|nr:YceI family protein [bacterium]MCI0602223.1 YceI family protein [bacterium]
MRKLVCILLLVSASFASAQIQNYKITPEQSALTFDVSAQMHQVHGISRDFSGTISGDPKDVTTAKITIRLDPKNFDTDNQKRDKVMREKSLEIEKFPFIEFESTAIEAVNKGLSPNQASEVIVKGVLKLHGVEKQVSIPVRVLWDETQLVADGSMDLKLDDYTIFRPKVLFFRLKNDVKVRFRISAERILE